MELGVSRLLLWAFFVVCVSGEAFVFHAESGTIRTPNYPRQYPANSDVSWTIMLQPFEKITFGMNFRDILISRFDCPKFGQGDYLDYFVNGTRDKRLTETDSLFLPRIPVSQSVTNITLRFVSDDEWAGCGLSIHYKIACDESRRACLNSGVCRVGRTLKETKPIQCLCPDGFTGARCVSRAVESLCHPGCMSGERCVVDSATKKAVCESQLSGWRHVAGQGMVDIDECEEGTVNSNKNICEGNLTCFNTPGSYYCGCDSEAGFVPTTDKEGKTHCEQGCIKPWVMFDDECYLFANDLAADVPTAKKWCEQAGGHLAPINSIEQNVFVGKHTRAALTWLDFSDVYGERNFTTSENDEEQSNSGGNRGRTRDSSSAPLSHPVFANWGPNYPDGSGDFAVIYPNRWVKGSCTEKKRFVCQAKAPFCPGNWFQPENSHYCYYQSTYAADHMAANHACKYLAIGGNLAPWTSFEATRLGPSFWETSDADEGRAHFWVGIVADKQTEMAMYLVPNATLESEPPGATYEGPAAASDDAGSGAADQETETSDNQVTKDGYHLVDEDGLLHGIEMTVSFDCGYLYPNKWADYAHGSSVSSNSKPGFVCKKSVKGNGAANE